MNLEEAKTKIQELTRLVNHHNPTLLPEKQTGNY